MVNPDHAQYGFAAYSFTLNFKKNSNLYHSEAQTHNMEFPFRSWSSDETLDELMRAAYCESVKQTQGLGITQRLSEDPGGLKT